MVILRAMAVILLPLLVRDTRSCLPSLVLTLDRKTQLRNIYKYRDVQSHSGARGVEEGLVGGEVDAPGHPRPHPVQEPRLDGGHGVVTEH